MRKCFLSDHDITELNRVLNVKSTSSKTFTAYKCFEKTGENPCAYEVQFKHNLKVLDEQEEEKGPWASKH